MRQQHNLNLNWHFKDDFQPEYINRTDFSDFESVHLPHTVREIPYDCFDQTMTCMVSTYARRFGLGDISGKRIVVSFEGVSAYYILYVNGARVAEHRGAFSSARFDITDAVRKGENTLVLMVDSNERDDIPPNGSTVDFLIYGGIYRDVTLFLLEECYIENAMFRYELNADDTALAFPELKLCNHNGGFGGELEVVIKKDGETFYEYAAQIVVPSGDTSVSLEPHTLSAVERWDVDAPHLYDVSLTLRRDGAAIDRHETRVGFRTVDVNETGFYLNGKKRKLIGANRHQSYPYVGFAMGRRAQRKDADILKHELGLNSVRCSHYMQSRYFLERCDELGLLVFEEVPGWGYIGGDMFKKVVLQDLANMVTTHFDHASIVIWGTRLNETGDDDALYERTNALCKRLDPSRPTTGVRWAQFSNLIEDIYSYNDYAEPSRGEFMLLEQQTVTGLAKKVPYIVSEYVGPTLPTKPWDSEERNEEYAIRHARALSKIMTSADYLGGYAWCMFDYNTHNDHNAAEKICYHGLLDMFRIPKFAAFTYASQKDPESGAVLEPCSNVGRGERNEPVPFYVLTNCDYIDVTLSSDETRRYFPSGKFPGLKHAPIEVTDNGEFWQNRWRGATIVGYVNGKPAAKRIYSDNPRLDKIAARADDAELRCDIVEETRVVCYFIDENKNRLLFHSGAVVVKTEGDIELIGPKIIPVRGGAAAFWVKTKPSGNRGKARVQVFSDRADLDAATVEIELV